MKKADRRLEGFIQDSADYLRLEFGLATEKSELKAYPQDTWREFCIANGFKHDDEGLFIPSIYKAYINEDSKIATTNSFHELFGHGLFCECALPGIDIVKHAGEKAELEDFLYSEKGNDYVGIMKQRILDYEGFAFWMESILCEETGCLDSWEKKKAELKKEYVQVWEYFKEKEDRLTRFGLLSKMGFPKHYNNERVVQLLRKQYGQDFGHIEFALLFGSRKPYSDIDVFVATSDKSENIFDWWIDVRQQNMTDLVYMADRFDISVTDPLFSGEIIYGNEGKFENLKERVRMAPITEEAIKYNISRSEQLKNILPHVRGTLQEKGCMSHIESYRVNAEELEKGNKCLTLANLKKATYTAFPSL